jgi:hypothetical protein
MTRLGGCFLFVADEVVALAADAGGEFGEFAAVARGEARLLFGAVGTLLFGGAHGFGAFEFQFHVEFGAFADGFAGTEAGVGDAGLESELERVEQSRSHFDGDALVDEGVLDFADGDDDGFGAVEEREFDAGVLVHSGGTAESDAALVSALPLVVEVAERVVTECGGAAFDAVGLDVGAEAKGSHGISWVLGKTSQVTGRKSQRFARVRHPESH